MTERNKLSVWVHQHGIKEKWDISSSSSSSCVQMHVSVGEPCHVNNTAWLKSCWQMNTTSICDCWTSHPETTSIKQTRLCLCVGFLNKRPFLNLIWKLTFTGRFLWWICVYLASVPLVLLLFYWFYYVISWMVLFMVCCFFFKSCLYHFMFSCFLFSQKCFHQILEADLLRNRHQNLLSTDLTSELSCWN